MFRMRDQPKHQPNNRYARLAKAAKTGDFAGIEITPETIRYRIVRGNTVAHICALNGHLDLIPRALLTPAVMSLRNDAGETVQDLIKKGNGRRAAKRAGRENFIREKTLERQARWLEKRRKRPRREPTEPWSLEKAEATLRRVFGLKDTDSA